MNASPSLLNPDYILVGYFEKQLARPPSRGEGVEREKGRIYAHRYTSYYCI
jgi:hypothetical protein